ncbi:MAG: phage holin family protein [Nocardioides sp.]
MSETTRPSPDEPIGALVHRLSEQIPELVRSEMRLAQVELTEKGKRAGIGVGAFGAAGLLAIFGLGTLIAAAVLALDLVLPAWAAALIVAAVLFLVAAAGAMFGKKEIATATPAAPESAIEGLKEDVATMKGARS